MLYRWMAKKPLQRVHNVFAATTGRGRAKPTGTEVTEVCQGETFEPTEAELTSFRDLMEPVGASLHVAESPVDETAVV